MSAGIGHMLHSTAADTTKFRSTLSIYRDYMIDLGAFSYGNPLFDLSLFHIVTHLLPPGFTEHIYHITEKKFLSIL